MSEVTQQAGLCSIIIPSYNRAHFMEGAFESLRQQTFTNWELIVIDDGSTDNTQEVLQALADTISQPVTTRRQENGGPEAARAHGLRLARGQYIAFFDSDDLWLPHHLQTCIDALEKNPEVDWVFGDGRRVELATGRVVVERGFYNNGQPRPFMQLNTRKSGDLYIIDDPRIFETFEVAAGESGLPCAFQKSVARSDMLRKVPMCTNLRVGEDRFYAFRLIKAGCRFAYFDDVHIEYQLHDGHCSAANSTATEKRRLEISQMLLRGWTDLLRDVPLNNHEKRVARRAIAQELFWVQGYQLYPKLGQHDEAMTSMRKALGYWPGNLGMWKTYLLKRLRRRQGQAA